MKVLLGLSFVITSLVWGWTRSAPPKSTAPETVLADEEPQPRRRPASRSLLQDVDWPSAPTPSTPVQNRFENAAAPPRPQEDVRPDFRAPSPDEKAALLADEETALERGRAALEAGDHEIEIGRAHV